MKPCPPCVAVVARADGVVLPGVGAFDDAMAGLAAKGLDDAVRRSIGSSDGGHGYAGCEHRASFPEGFGIEVGSRAGVRAGSRS